MKHTRHYLRLTGADCRAFTCVVEGVFGRRCGRTKAQLAFEKADSATKDRDSESSEPEQTFDA